jgi:hypothetical protein
MRKLKEVEFKTSKYVPTDIICDWCNKRIGPQYEYSNNCNGTHIGIDFGYGSRHDEASFECDICDDCFDEFIKPKGRWV